MNSPSSPSTTMWNRLATLEARQRRYQTMMGISVMGYLILITIIVFLADRAAKRELAVSKLSTEHLELVDSRGRVRGELYVGASGVARLYLGGQSDTSLSFTSDEDGRSSIMIGNDRLYLAVLAENDELSLFGIDESLDGAVFLMFHREEDWLHIATATNGPVKIADEVVVFETPPNIRIGDSRE